MYAAAVGAAAHAGYSLPNPMQQINTINMQQAGQIIAQPSTSAASQTSVVTTEQVSTMLACAESFLRQEKPEEFGGKQFGLICKALLNLSDYCKLFYFISFY